MAGGFLLAFASGFGQTFFISLFTPYFLEQFALSQSSFGSIYAAATLVSGLLFLSLGGLLDRVSPVKYTVVSFISFAVFCLAMGFIENAYFFAICLFGLRLCGQGLMSHISATITARSFLGSRGKALSIASLGHPASEAVLPLLAVSIIQVADWKSAWVFFAVLLFFVVLPLSIYLLGGEREAHVEKDELSFSSSQPGKYVPYFVKTYLFWLVTLGSILPGSILTGVFLYHGVIGTDRDWSLTLLASGFTWFAGAQLFSSLIGGDLLDRIGARNLFGIYLLPLSAGLILLSTSVSPWFFIAYMILSGITAGLGGPLKTAIWAEAYGTREIAKVRSWVGTVAVIGTAISPALMGILLDSGFSIETILKFAAAFVVLYCLICYSKVAGFTRS